MKEMDPHDFEGLVLDVLAAMGYGGGSRQAMQGVPRGPDGGIDGKINEDKLGLDQIYMQAKRYSENSVSSEKVQAFVGAGSSAAGVRLQQEHHPHLPHQLAGDLEGIGDDDPAGGDRQKHR